MIIRRPADFPPGYTPCIAPAAEGLDMSFGILRLRAGVDFTSTGGDNGGGERLFHLLGGSVSFSWEGGAAKAARASLLNELPSALHVPAGVSVTVKALSAEAELAVYAAGNPRAFPARFFGPADIERAVLKPAALGGTADREIRTILDDRNAPFSVITAGEVVNGAGKWSSFPPHHHPQWEMYHFRSFPANGFAYSEQGEEVFKVRDGDTAVIPPGLAHPQCAAPGDSLLYLWAIRHLEGNRFGSDSRIFVPEHAWTLK